MLISDKKPRKTWFSSRRIWSRGRPIDQLEYHSNVFSLKLVKCHLEQCLQCLSLFIYTQQMVSYLSDLILFNKSTFCRRIFRKCVKGQVNRFEFLLEGDFLVLCLTFIKFFSNWQLADSNVQFIDLSLLRTGWINLYRTEICLIIVFCVRNLKSATRVHWAVRLLLILITIAFGFPFVAIHLTFCWTYPVYKIRQDCNTTKTINCTNDIRQYLLWEQF